LPPSSNIALSTSLASTITPTTTTPTMPDKPPKKPPKDSTPLVPPKPEGTGDLTAIPEQSGQNSVPVISLPFSVADTPYEMMPLGETINHPDPPNTGGHPGIDFMWDRSVDIIACANGTVIFAEKTASHDKWDVYVKTDDIIIGYTTLETVEEYIKVGNKITAGQKIGETGFFGHAMIHWELERELRGTRFCPMAYLDEASRQRILDIWDKTKWPEMKGPFPHICNGYYRCDFCIQNGY